MNWTSVTNYSLQFNMRSQVANNVFDPGWKCGNVFEIFNIATADQHFSLSLCCSHVFCQQRAGTTCWCSTELGVSEFKFSYTYWNKDANLLVHQHLDDFYLQYVLYGKCKFHFSMTEVTQVMHTKLTFSLS